MQSQIVKLIRKSVAVNPNILHNDFESLSLSFFLGGWVFFKANLSFGNILYEYQSCIQANGHLSCDVMDAAKSNSLEILLEPKGTAGKWLNCLNCFFLLQTQLTILISVLQELFHIGVTTLTCV